MTTTASFTMSMEVGQLGRSWSSWWRRGRHGGAGERVPARCYGPRDMARRTIVGGPPQVEPRRPTIVPPVRQPTVGTRKASRAGYRAHPSGRKNLSAPAPLSRCRGRNRDAMGRDASLGTIRRPPPPSVGGPRTSVASTSRTEWTGGW